VKVSPLTGGALAVSADDAERLESSIRIPPQVNAWTVMIDPEKTQPSSFTTYKTTRRDFYTNARDRVGIKSMTEPNEVLIISNTDDGIMEGSLTSVFFWRNGNWVTPPVASGGQAGTTRRWYLEKGFCKEEPVNIKTLVDGEECWISNGVRGLVWGKIKL
jgi:branched-subunit amino acid aminotransferase/4-amino-4-deoxychorismate lyase